MNTINDFKMQIADSESPEARELFSKAYHYYFKDIADIFYNTAGKSLSQDLGIDALILLKSGKILKIDEKLRDVDYGDILIEFKSNSNGNTDNGWVNKDLHIDYIAYGVTPSQKVFIIEWESLKKAWLEHGEKWKAEYKISVAKNVGYNTHSVCIPYRVLQEALTERWEYPMDKIKKAKDIPLTNEELEAIFK